MLRRDFFFPLSCSLSLSLSLSLSVVMSSVFISVYLSLFLCMSVFSLHVFLSPSQVLAQPMTSRGERIAPPARMEYSPQHNTTPPKDSKGATLYRMIAHNKNKKTESIEKSNSKKTAKKQQKQHQHQQQQQPQHQHHAIPGSVTLHHHTFTHHILLRLERLELVEPLHHLRRKFHFVILRVRLKGSRHGLPLGWEQSLGFEFG